jgi:hypothetical protein
MAEYISSQSTRGIITQVSRYYILILKKTDKLQQNFISSTIALVGYPLGTERENLFSSSSPGKKKKKKKKKIHQSDRF